MADVEGALLMSATDPLAAHSGPLGPAGPPGATGVAGTVHEQQPAAKVPETVEVRCGNITGTLLIQKTRVVYEGNEISPTEFEKLGGRALAKKWKASLRVLRPDGSSGRPVGDWLADNNIIPPNQRNHAPRPARLLHKAAVPRILKEAKQGTCSAQDIYAHLDRQCAPIELFLGEMPGDPTVSELPQELPASDAGTDDSSMTVIDMASISYEDLMAMSAASAPNPMRALLPKQPGVLRDRLAVITGHKRETVRAAAGSLPPKDSQEAKAVIEDYLAGKGSLCPWECLGARGPVTVDGKELDLRRLHALVSEQGGYNQTCQDKKWASFAKVLGINREVCTNCAYLCRINYKKYLMQYDKQQISSKRATGDTNSIAAASQSVEPTLGATVGDVQTVQKRDGEQPTQSGAASPQLEAAGTSSQPSSHHRSPPAAPHSLIASDRLAAGPVAHAQPGTHTDQGKSDATDSQPFTQSKSSTRMSGEADIEMNDAPDDGTERQAYVLVKVGQQAGAKAPTAVQHVIDVEEDPKAMPRGSGQHKVIELD